MLQDSDSWGNLGNLLQEFIVGVRELWTTTARNGLNISQTFMQERVKAASKALASMIFMKGN